MEATFKYCSHFNVYKNDVYEQKKKMYVVFTSIHAFAHMKKVFIHFIKTLHKLTQCTAC